MFKSLLNLIFGFVPDYIYGHELLGHVNAIVMILNL